MNINGLGKLYDRTHETYRSSKYAQSFSDFLDKINESKGNVSGISVQEAYERMSGSGKALPEAGQDV